MLLPPYRTLAALALASILGACALPQDVGEERQILKGAADPAASFAVQTVSRDTLPMMKDWPNSHPVADLGWIRHSATNSDPLIEAGDTVSLIVWDNDETSLLSTPSQNVIQLPNLRYLFLQRRNLSRSTLRRSFWRQGISMLMGILMWWSLRVKKVRSIFCPAMAKAILRLCRRLPCPARSQRLQQANSIEWMVWLIWR